MIHKHRELKNYHKLFILIGGWQGILGFLVAAIGIWVHLYSINTDLGGTNKNISLIFGSIFAICFAVYNIFKNYKFIGILKNGLLTDAKFRSKEIHKSGDEDSATVYKYTFEFNDENEHSHLYTFKSKHKSRLEDEGKELLMYLKDKPKKALVLDHLPWPINKYVKKNWTIVPEEDQNTFIKRY